MSLNSGQAVLKNKEIAPGIIAHVNARAELSGFYLDNDRNAQMPRALRLDSGFYRKQLDWSRVVIAFPAYFRQDVVNRALWLLIRYRPMEYYYYLLDSKTLPYRWFGARCEEVPGDAYAKPFVFV